MLVEIETYPARDADRQLFEDLQIVALVRNVIPEVVCLVLRPRGQVQVTGTAERVSRRGRTRLSASWQVVRLWDLRAEDLLAVGDVGLVPWVPLTRSDEPPEVVLGRCRERIDGVSDPSDRAGLLAVTQILGSLVYGDPRLLDLLGGFDAMIESPYLDEVIERYKRETYPKLKAQAEAEAKAEVKARFEAEVKAQVKARFEAEVKAQVEAEVKAQVEAEVKAEVKAEIKAQVEAEVKAQGLRDLRDLVKELVIVRFPEASPGHLAPLDAIDDSARLRALHRLAATGPTLEAFLQEARRPVR